MMKVMDFEGRLSKVEALLDQNKIDRNENLERDKEIYTLIRQMKEDLGMLKGRTDSKGTTVNVDSTTNFGDIEGGVKIDKKETHG